MTTFEKEVERLYAVHSEKNPENPSQNYVELEDIISTLGWGHENPHLTLLGIIIDELDHRLYPLKWKELERQLDAEIAEERIIKARKEGYDEGFNEGWSEGYDNGFGNPSTRD